MRITFALVLLCMLSCKQDQVVLSAEQVFLDQALVASGGFDNWNNLEELTFTKKTRMYLPDSTIEMESLQRQTFRNYPSFSAEIEYLNDSLGRRIVQEGEQVMYFENGEEVQDPEKVKKAATSIQIAYYVIGLPFKLMDKGVNLRAVSDEKLMDGRGMKSLHVVHDSNPDQNWWVYFNPTNNQMSGYLIDHDNRFSYILNDKTTTIKGFPFPLKRRSIAMDNERKNPYLRADYVYSELRISLYK